MLQQKKMVHLYEAYWGEREEEELIFCSVILLLT